MNIRDLQEDIENRIKWATIAFIDVTLLCFWLLIQHIAGYFINIFKISWIDQWVLLFFQIIFAIYTLISLVINVIYKDIRKMIPRDKSQNTRIQGDKDE